MSILSSAVYAQYNSKRHLYFPTDCPYQTKISLIPPTESCNPDESLKSKEKMKRKLKSIQKKSKDDSSSSGSQDSAHEVYYKMVFVVNSSLNMGIGTICAQVAHACLGMYRELADMGDLGDIVEDWELDGEKKIVVVGVNHIHLLELQEMAEENNVHSYLVQDSTYEQVASNCMTVLGLFGEINRVDNVSGDLPLL